MEEHQESKENKEFKHYHKYEELPKGASEEMSVRLSRQRTTLSFQRTRLAADRTLMGVIRTALSLIGFGFTIFQFFRSFKNFKGLKVDPSELASQIGVWLVAIGIVFLTLGIIYHTLFMYQVRKEREKLDIQGLINKHDTFPISMTFLTAVLLLLLGIFVIFKMILAAFG